MATTTHLHEGPGVSITDYACRCRRGGPAEEEVSDASHIVFVRRGVFCRHIEGREEILDANHLVFFQKGETYRVSHPTDLGDDCTVLSLTPELCAEALSLSASNPKLSDSIPFETSSRVLSPNLFYRHWGLLRLVTMRAPSMDIDEAACELVDEVFGQDSPERVRAPRASTRRAHDELVNEAKLLLNSSVHEAPSLVGLAKSLSTSPFHLSRVFKRELGVGLAEYSAQLRVHAAADRLARTKSSIGEIAAGLGFSSPSYFVYRFRQTTGLTPMQYRVNVGLAPRPRGLEAR